MMYLNLHTKKVKNTKNEYQVIWTKRRDCLDGVVHVVVTPDNIDQMLVAEIDAARFLLMEKNVFKRPMTGKGICMVYSQSDFDIMADPEGLDYPESPYAHSFYTRFSDSEYRYEPDWISAYDDDLSDLETDHLTVDHAVHDFIESPEIGRIILTRKAMQEYRKEIEQEIGKPVRYSLSNLAKRLLNSRPQRIELPLCVVEYKRKRWDHVAEFYSAKCDVFHYVIVDGQNPYEGQYKIMLTVYARRKSQKKHSQRTILSECA